MQEINPPDACFDVPDKRDYLYTETFWATGDIPRTITNNRTKIYNQGAVNMPSTIYACTCYSATHCVNELNAIEAERYGTTLKKEVDPVVIWTQALQRGANVKKWWSLQGAVKLMMDLWCIQGYTLCKTVSEVKQALARWQLLQTGSNSIDWKKTVANDNIVVKWESYWHAFMCEGYDDIKWLLVMRNSYGENAMFHGRFFVQYKNFNLLFSCYAYVDSTSPEIRNAQVTNRRQLAKQRWYWNGNDADVNLIRQDAARMAGKLGKVDEPSELWNWKNGTTPVIRQDFRTMLEKATGRKIQFDIGNPAGNITRGEASEWTVRV